MAAYRGCCGASSGVPGRLGASLGCLELDFHTKLKHSILDVILYSICYCSPSFFPVLRTRKNALWYYKNNSFEPYGDFDTKLFKDAILEPTCPHIASQNALKSRLGVVLGPLGVVLGPLGALLQPSWGHLGRLNMQSGEVAKTYKNQRKINVFGISGGPR